jgi:flavin reductase (DIM6/NTAB) family NADH-FMN oxidoreductase RutF
MEEHHMKEISWNEAIELGSPYPYTLVVTIDKDGKPDAMGLSWWTITSWDPHMIAVAIGGPRYTRECIEQCKEFVLCFPSEDLEKGAWLCGQVSGREADKFKEAGFRQVPSKMVKPPIIEGSTVAYECKVVDQIETGDHTLYIGKVVAIHGTPEKKKHLFTIHYRKVISLDKDGYSNFHLQHE